MMAKININLRSHARFHSRPVPKRDLLLKKKKLKANKQPKQAWLARRKKTRWPRDNICMPCQPIAVPTRSSRNRAQPNQNGRAVTFKLLHTLRYILKSFSFFDDRSTSVKFTTNLNLVFLSFAYTLKVDGSTMILHHRQTDRNATCVHQSAQIFFLMMCAPSRKSEKKTKRLTFKVGKKNHRAPPATITNT